MARPLLAGILTTGAAAALCPTRVNGHPALALHLSGELDSVLSARVDDGRITGLYAVRNAEKPSHRRRATDLRR